MLCAIHREAVHSVCHQGAFINAGKNRCTVCGAGVAEEAGVADGLLVAVGVVEVAVVVGGVDVAVIVGVGVAGVPSVSDANENTMVACADVVSSPTKRKFGIAYGQPGLGIPGQKPL